jgi:CheY-like chemotaxis protein
MGQELHKPEEIVAKVRDPVVPCRDAGAAGGVNPKEPTGKVKRTNEQRTHMTSSDRSFQLSPKYRILCVDDLLSLESRAALFEEEGYSVTSVSCPKMALAHDMSRFHLAVLDFDMPVLNGFQLSLRLRAARATFPIVLLSGMSRQLPNDMRNVFSICLDNGEPIHLLLDTVRSCLTSISETPTWQVIGSSDQSWRLKTEVPESTEQEPLFCGLVN